MTEHRFPVAGTDRGDGQPLTIPWDVAKRAYRTWKAEFQYDHPNHLVPNLEYWEGQGGWTQTELDTWVPGWREVAR